MKNLLKNLILIILIIAVAGGIGFLIFNAARSNKVNENAKNPIVTLSVEGYGEVKIELYPDYAPNTVKTIIKLIEEGFYDGKVFYGTDGKAISAGMKLKTSEEYPEGSYDDEGNLKEGAELKVTETAEESAIRVSTFDKSVTPYVSDEENGMPMPEDETNGDEETDYKVSINGEFVANGFKENTMRFEYGTVGLYRAEYPAYESSLTTESYNSGTSLFFIETEEDSSLNGQYAAFGKVIEGMDIIMKMKELPLAEKTEEEQSSNDSISKFAQGSYPVITTAKVETYGIDYGMPKYEKAFDYNKYMSDLILKYYQNK